MYQLYLAPKSYLLYPVSQHLKPIKYDREAQLYWKRQLESPSAAGEKGLAALEKENLRTIEEVYSALTKDKNIQAYIEKIKAHEWVKVVEGER